MCKIVCLYETGKSTCSIKFDETKNVQIDKAQNYIHGRDLYFLYFLHGGTFLVFSLLPKFYLSKTYLLVFER